MSEQMGVPFQAALQRISSGRFSAKTGLDKSGAAKLASTLESMGLVCSVTLMAPKPATAPPPVPGTNSAVLGVGTSPAAKQVLPQQALSQPPAPQQTAESFDTLSGSLSLSMLDGDSDAPIQPAQGSHPEVSPDWDQFRPPDMNSEEKEITLDIPAQALIDQSAPPANFAKADPVNDAEISRNVPLAASGSVKSTGHSQPNAAVTAEKTADLARAGVDRAKELFVFCRREIAESERLRFFVGGLLAVLLCFLPTHLIASAMESASYGGAEETLNASYDQLVKSWEYHQMELELEKAKGAASTSRLIIGFVGTTIWMLTAAGFLFLWFRKVNWQRYVFQVGVSSS